MNDVVNRAFRIVLSDLLYNYVECHDCHKLLNYEKGEVFICMACTSQVLCQPCYYRTRLHEWEQYRFPRRCQQCCLEYLRKYL
jgi:hypothetical protein